MSPQETALAESVATELDWDGRLEVARIRVLVVDDVVVLLGQVSSYEEKCAAARAASRADGALFVDNRLVVVLTPEAQISDYGLRRTVLQALQREPQVPNGRIMVFVRDGWVTLQGVADLPLQIDASLAAVRRLPGVVGLRNELTLRSRTS